MKSIWNIVSALAGILAVGVAVFVFFYARSSETKRIEVQIISKSSLVNESVSKSNQTIEVLYGGKKIPNYSILQCRIANIGGQPIRSADYEKPIALSLLNIRELLSAEQIASDPQNLKVKTLIKQNTIELSNDLLNPGDWFNLGIGVVPETGKEVIIKTAGRIAGVKRIEFRESVPEASRKRYFDWIQAIALVQAGLVSIMMVIQLWMRRRRHR